MSSQNQTMEIRSSQDQPKFVPAGTGRALFGPGTRMTFLITGEETGGAFFMSESLIAPGGGPPPHVHSREDESFYLQQGTLVIRVGDQVLNASAGDFVYLPRGIAHSFRNVSNETARLLSVSTPAGLEHYFEEVFLPADDIADTAGIPQIDDAMIARVIQASPKYGLELSLPTPRTAE